MKKSINTNVKYCVLYFFVVLLIGSNVSAQSSSSYRAMGMAGTHTAIAGDTDAFRWNPALLGAKSKFTMEDDYRWTIDLFSLGAFVRNNSFTLGDYNDYNGKDNVISESDKDDIIDKLDDGNLQFWGGSNGRILSLAFNIPQYGISLGYDMSYTAKGYTKLDKDFFEMILKDNVAGSKYSFKKGDVDASGFGAASFGLFMSKDVYEIDWLKQQDIDMSVGFGIKHLKGYGYTQVQKFEGDIELVDVRGDGSIIQFVGDGESSVITAEKGSGFAMDFGIAGQKDRISAGLSITNMLGSITWDEEVQEEYGKFSVEFFGPNEIDDFDTTSTDTTYELTEEKMDMPTKLRLGAGYQIKDNWLVAADLQRDINNTAGVESKTRFSIGTEYYPWRIFPLRAGLSLGGIYKTSFSMGTGLEYDHFSFGISTFNIFQMGYVVKSISVGMGMKFRF